MNTWLSRIDINLLIALAVVLLALALFIVGAAILGRAFRQARSQAAMEKALAARGTQGTHNPTPVPPEQRDAWTDAVSTAAALGTRWSTGRLAELLIADEDRQLIASAGYLDQAKARALFLFARAVLSIALPLAALLWLGRTTILGSHALGVFVVLFVGFALGLMLPKWVVARRAKQRKLAAAEELPLLIDILRLLQGVGLSIDQSLHVVVHEFAEVMPVLARELHLAVDQYTRGRSREQSLARLATDFDNDDLSAICRLIAQVDQHGGAVQQPLLHFSERLREQRKLDLKEKVGKLTVKMTGVMVLTLMPALLIVTGGAGFLAIIRGLSRMGGG
ncbi:type II secretion system F family protein [Allopusillimonas soli]|uniref:Type II secretion system F family protein n=1 Tax=Allopusillimonas soli TaxID=659016 RepID=A0A853FD67_9BURK|nr:type II secretion system F family protein [Allopusillimonas soli]NYT38794.1 type II secretion system F family protein [Allopusillimonas soli]TEA70229.1 type II secretion system F family protein [Allopusillimonas soli]